jgi:hypothetical protein
VEAAGAVAAAVGALAGGAVLAGVVLVAGFGARFDIALFARFGKNDSNEPVWSAMPAIRRIGSSTSSSKRLTREAA